MPFDGRNKEKDNTMNMNKKWVLPVCVVGAFLLYMLVCGGIFFASVIKMNRSNALSNDVETGRLAYRNSVAYELYSTEEIAENPALQGVKIDFFAAEGQENRFVVVCPGGGYTGVSVEQEGYPVAEFFRQRGYSAFVLTYRTGKNCSYYAPIEDLARALRFIIDHRETFSVNKDSYALCGFSAGGNLIGLFGSEEYGYYAYDLPEPELLIMGYAWCNPNVSSKGNLVETIAHSVLNEQGQEAFLEGADLSEMQVPLYVTEYYPPCYLMHGTADTIVPAWSHSRVLCEKLQENGVPYRYEEAEGVYHGCGVGKGTSCEGWLARATAYWDELYDWTEDDYQTTLYDLDEGHSAEVFTRKIGGFACGVCHPVCAYDVLEDLGVGWVRFDIDALPFLADGTQNPDYLFFKEEAKSYRDRGIKVLAVTPYPDDYIKAGYDPRTEKGQKEIMKIARFYVEDLQGCVNAFQVTNEMGVDYFRAPLTIRESADFMGIQLKAMYRYRGDIVIGYNLATNNIGYVLEAMKPYNAYVDYVGVDLYLGCFDAVFDRIDLAFVVFRYVYELTDRPIMINEFGYMSTGQPKTDSEKKEILLSYGSQGETLQEAEEYAREHVTEILGNEAFPQKLRAYVEVSCGWSESMTEDEKIAVEKEMASMLFDSVTGHLYCELAEGYQLKGLDHTQDGQSDFFVEYFDKMEEADYLCGAFIYQLQDGNVCYVCGQVDCPVETGWGLLDVNGTPKKSYYTLQGIFADLTAEE